MDSAKLSLPNLQSIYPQSFIYPESFIIYLPSLFANILLFICLFIFCIADLN